MHFEAMKHLKMTRHEYLAAIRKGQPISELKRKSEKSGRRKCKIWTQEQIDFIAAESIALLNKAHPLSRA